MNTHENILKSYAQVLLLTEGMLEAVKASDWERLSRLEQEISQHIAQLSNIEDTVTLSSSERASKKAIIVRLLELDAEVQKLASEGLSKMSRSMTAARNQKQINNAYGNSGQE